MEQKNLIIAIAVSVAIMLGFQYFAPKPAPAPVQQQTTAQTTQAPAVPGIGPAPSVVPDAASTATATALLNAPRVKIESPNVTGSLSLLGARLDDLVLSNYRDTLEANSSFVHLFEPRGREKPYYAQFGWTGIPGVRVPDNDTVWSATATTLSPTQPVTLFWENGAGLRFEIALKMEPDYLIGVQQRVINNGSEPVQLTPWARIRREYLPHTAGYTILHEGMTGVLNGTLQEHSYSNVRDEAKKRDGGPGFEGTSVGGWAGITDKYWLAALIPDQQATTRFAYRHVSEAGADRFQVDIARDTTAIAPGATQETSLRVFAGAKEVRTLDHIRDTYNVPNFDKAIDFGWFYFLTKPFFYAIDWLFKLTGNFGIAIIAFTLLVKILFFPLANKSYKSMSKMKLLAPKMQELKTRFGDDAQGLQREMMALYKSEKVNPASGCLPILIQIPVFFSLYKVLFVTIEMRHAPFFGWIKDLSAIDPTNVFNLFGLIPFDPSAYSNWLHMGIWPLLMGITMFLQQRLNPAPPDPVQAKIFQWMPIVFTFMLAGFPAGLVIYWTWNNLLSIAQQWYIMRQTSVGKPGKVSA